MSHVNVLKMPETTENEILPAPVFWAQRSNLVYVRIAVEDCDAPHVTVEKSNIHFRANAGNPKRVYESHLELFDAIRPSESKWVQRDRGMEFVLIKENPNAPFWKRLLKDEKRYHWIKIDFNKWKDEDDSDSEAPGGGGGGLGGGNDFEDMMRQMGGLSGAGGPEDLGDLDGPDSDDEELPDLEPK